MREWIIAPFKGIRFNPEKIADIAAAIAPPYDVISEEKQKALYARSPHNIVRLDYGMQIPTDGDGENRYTRSARDLHEWIQKKILIQDAQPAIYLYEQSFDVDSVRYHRRGFFALRKLEEFEKGNVLPHEKTLSGPKADRLELMRATAANLSPIFGLYHDPASSAAKLLEPFFEKPLYEFMDEGKIQNRLWKVTDEATLMKLDALLRDKKIFIADGHHRYETAIRYRDEFRRRPEVGDQPHSVDYVLMFFAEMSDPGLLILPTHRVLQNWPRFDKNAFLENIAKTFKMRTIDDTDRFVAEVLNADHEGHRLGLSFPGDKTHYVLEKSFTTGSALNRVGTFVLHEEIFKTLQMTDQDERNSHYLRFVKDTQETLKALAEPHTNCIFLIKAPGMDLLREVAEEKKILPPKTTYFYPKIPTGLLLHKMDFLS